MLHKIREVAMLRKQTHGRQKKFVFVDGRLWEQLPEKNRLRCRELLIRLLSEVVYEQEAREESEDEREGNTRTP